MSERDFLKTNLITELEDMKRRLAELERYARVLDDGHVGVVNNLYDATSGAGLFASDGDLVVPGDVIPAGNLVGTSTSLADDAITSITPMRQYGALLITPRVGYSSRGLIAYRCIAGGAFCYIIAVSSTVEVKTGALASSADGNDNIFTVSAHTNGRLYFLNRLGGPFYFHYLLLGA